MTRVCVPVTEDGQVGSRWGRADRVALADVTDGEITDWTEIDVGWHDAHDQGTEGAHHARVARFLRDQHVSVVVAHHMGPGMHTMLQKLGLQVQLEATGDARVAALTQRS